MDDLQDRVGSSVNGTGTSGNTDTPVTQRRSADVPGISKTIGALDTTRRLHGANTEIGWDCSNAIEQLKSLAKETSPAAITALKHFAAATLRRLRTRLKENAATHNSRTIQFEQRNRQAGEG